MRPINWGREASGKRSRDVGKAFPGGQKYQIEENNSRERKRLDWRTERSGLFLVFFFFSFPTQSSLMSILNRKKKKTIF